jgi:hypothetical protein
MIPEELYSCLQRQTRRLIHLRINDNRQTLLSARRSRSVLHLSIHKMFLDAPDQVIDALALWMKGKESRESRAAIRHFIREGSSELRSESKLVTRGDIYDLQPAYDEVNRDYFEGELDLRFTWFGRQSRRRWGRKKLGEYCYGSQLVRIHRQLDDARCPWQYLHFVLYHEMLHHVVPAKVAPSGRLLPHTRHFREREREFAHYEWVKEWEKKSLYGWA